jgi:hypothetical protein
MIGKMEEELRSIIKDLKYYSEEYHEKGIKLSDTHKSLAEWYFGRSEGLETAIEMLLERTD